MPTNPARKFHMYSRKDSYRDYKKYKKEQSEECVSYAEYTRLLEAMLLAIARKLIYENFVFNIPNGLGKLYVKAMRCNWNAKNLNWDFKTKRNEGYWKKYLCDNTYGTAFGMKWNTRGKNFRNRVFYKFKHIKSVKAMKAGVGTRGLAAHINELANDPTKKQIARL